ncbi:MAG: hypothetical protein U0V74_09045 [Chitinophagales bacterium]
MLDVDDSSKIELICIIILFVRNTMPFQEIPDRFTTPPDHLSISRYFTESKFADLIRTSSLYFNKISNFPPADEMLFSLYDLNWIRTHRGERAEMEIEVYKEEQTTSFINCWTYDVLDWRRFWETYGNCKNAVMIKVSVGRLKRELDKSDITLICPW